jgi:putative nucleotidyltransferase with HDIG domain
MRLDVRTFDSRIAFRIFSGFIICALGPVLCFSALIYYEFSHKLEKNGIAALRNTSETLARTLQDRLKLAEAELTARDADAGNGPSAAPINRKESLDEAQAYELIPGTSLDSDRIAIVRTDLEVGSFQPVRLSPGEIDHLRAGRTLVVESRASGGPASIWLVRALTYSATGRMQLTAGYLNLEYLWSADDSESLPEGVGIFILDSSGGLLRSSAPDGDRLSETLAAGVREAVSGEFEFRMAEIPYLAGFTQLFLKPNYMLTGWSVIVFQRRSDMLQSLEEFKTKFPPIALGVLLIAAWLSIVTIRRRMVPLEKLIEGTKRIAAGDFYRPIAVSTRDEFSQLAASFNDMADKIGHSFHVLSARAEIDRAVLSAFDSEKIAGEAVRRMADCIGGTEHGLCLVDPSATSAGRSYFRQDPTAKTVASASVKISPAEKELAFRNAVHWIRNEGDPQPGFVVYRSGKAPTQLLVAPLFFNKELIGFLWAGVGKQACWQNEDIQGMRQLADQLAIALSNARMMAEQKEMSWGALIALARTVDAKSPWTAGHSMRVMELAVATGTEMNLDKKAIETLHRAALLHDIGKVGIRSSILDKSGRLSEQEFLIIKSHPRIGANIIEPIAAFREIVPIVAQHHERFDGRGYPFGYCGDRIHWAARILAVADTFDAMTSDRPYRRGMGTAEALEKIAAESGRQFEPAVVTALEGVFRAGRPDVSMSAILNETVKCDEKEQKSAQAP